jgi:ATP-dependent Clp protease protease subunit
MTQGYIPIPFVIEKTGRGERQYDIYSRLLEDRIVFIGTPIDDTVANVVIAQLLFLQKENRNQDINLYINSPGGSVTAAWRSTTRCSSCSATSPPTASARLVDGLACCSPPAARASAIAAQLADHDPPAVGGVQGTAADISIQAEEILRLKKTLNEIMARHTGKDIKQVEKDATATSSCRPRRPRLTVSWTRW